MKKKIIFLLLFSALLLSACNGSDALSGKTFDITYASPLVEIDEASGNDTLMTVEFSDGKVVTDAFQGGEGKYKLIDDELELHFENENEHLKIKFKVEDSEQDSSEYAAKMSDIDFEITNPDEISHFKSLYLKLNKDIPVEFLKK